MPNLMEVLAGRDHQTNTIVFLSSPSNAQLLSQVAWRAVAGTECLGSSSLVFSASLALADPPLILQVDWYGAGFIWRSGPTM